VHYSIFRLWARICKNIATTLGIFLVLANCFFSFKILQSLKNVPLLTLYCSILSVSVPLYSCLWKMRLFNSQFWAGSLTKCLSWYQDISANNIVTRLTTMNVVSSTSSISLLHFFYVFLKFQLYSYSAHISLPKTLYPYKTHTYPYYISYRNYAKSIQKYNKHVSESNRKKRNPKHVSILDPIKIMQTPSKTYNKHIYLKAIEKCKNHMSENMHLQPWNNNCHWTNT
jgi:hypothetical protein